MVSSSAEVRPAAPSRGEEVEGDGEVGEGGASAVCGMPDME